MLCFAWIFGFDLFSPSNWVLSGGLPVLAGDQALPSVRLAAPCAPAAKHKQFRSIDRDHWILGRTLKPRIVRSSRNRPTRAFLGAGSQPTDMAWAFQSGRGGGFVFFDSPSPVAAAFDSTTRVPPYERVCWIFADFVRQSQHPTASLVDLVVVKGFLPCATRLPLSVHLSPPHLAPADEHLLFRDISFCFCFFSVSAPVHLWFCDRWRCSE